ncbi:MAG: STAS domain-containing protein [Fibrobacter sp.]|nr:STAS domain-containing protein [Fibrobacter sp.]
MTTTLEEKLIVTVCGTDETPIIELAGQIIDSDVKKFQKHIDQIHKTKCSRIYLDVSKATYIDSHGLGTIVYYHTLMQKEKRELIIVNGNTDKSTYLSRMFDQTNLDKVLTIVNKI